MNTHKLFNLTIALIFGVSLLGTPASISAQEPLPHFAIHPDSDAIAGWWGWPLGTNITFSVDDPSPWKIPITPE